MSDVCWLRVVDVDALVEGRTFFLLLGLLGLVAGGFNHGY
jgi:hypothetical protein